jgi:hypothetical protein
METESVHLDKFGTVLKNVDDGDNHVYEHDDAKTTADVDKNYSSKNTGAGGKDIGELGGIINADNIIRNLLNKNIATAKDIDNPFTFKNLVKDHGDWDYKNTGDKTIFGLAEQNEKTGGITQFKYYGLSMTAEDFGNFHFGVVGKATGLFPEQFMLEQAGEAQIKSGTSRPEWQIYRTETVPIEHRGTTNVKIPLPPYGDDPLDQKMIKMGFSYYMALTGN